MNTHVAMTALRTADPVPHQPRLDERAAADFDRIIATPRAAAKPARRGFVVRPGRLALAGALACLTAIAVVVPSVVPTPGAGSRVAYAATPDPLRVLDEQAFTQAGLSETSTAPELVASIAARVQALPDDTGSGRYAKTVIEGWALWTRVDGEQVTSEVVPQMSTSWTAADGSGRVVTEIEGPGTARSADDDVLAAGERALMWPLASLSADDATLASQLESNHPVGNGPAERLVATLDAAAEQPQTPAVRAAMLRYLAQTPGLTTTGMVSDRAGRTGLAVHVTTSMSGLPERRTVIIDPNTGRILGGETTLTETAGKLNVPVPSVISYTNLISSEYVADLR